MTGAGRKREAHARELAALPAAKTDLAHYAAEMLASLSRLSAENGMTLLAHLTDLARIEALRNREPR